MSSNWYSLRNQVFDLANVCLIYATNYCHSWNILPFRNETHTHTRAHLAVSQCTKIIIILRLHERARACVWEIENVHDSSYILINCAARIITPIKMKIASCESYFRWGPCSAAVVIHDVYFYPHFRGRHGLAITNVYRTVYCCCKSINFHLITVIVAKAANKRKMFSFVSLTDTRVTNKSQNKINQNTKTLSCV